MTPALTTEPPRLLRVEDAARLLNIGRSATYDLIRSGRLRSIKVGKSRRIPVDAINEAITALTEENSR